MSSERFSSGGSPGKMSGPVESWREVGSARPVAAGGARPPVTPPPGVGVRKVVTVLFSDVVDSTTLGEQLDPEALRPLLTRYFGEMSAVIARHGGTVEKFIGDAVMAVFGVPQVHEDDALRAVRAAVEMRDVLEALNGEFEATWGVRIASRTGVNTGEVMADSSPTATSFVSGDPVNVAARLEQAAQPGEILIGGTTYRMVRDAVVAESAGSVAVKGKSEPVSRWRLLGVTSGAGVARRLDSPLIGRDAQLRRLQDAFERTVQGSVAELVTVMAPAGVGKSRLANELVATLGDRATTLVGSCTPYGDSMSLAPVVGVLRAAASLDETDTADDVRAKVLQQLEPDPDAALVFERVAPLLGLPGVSPGLHETFWGLRKLLEALARKAPLIVLFDDIHWADPALLDLIEYLADCMRGVPVLLLCLSRPELLELRSSWTGPRTNSSIITLQPLPESDTGELIRNLLDGGELADDVAGRIRRLSEGNPLFVEETLRMLVDDGMLTRRGDRWVASGDLSALSIPPTIHALLTARLDRLLENERLVIERAAVVGRTFWWGAVCSLASETPVSRVSADLQSLIRKELIRAHETDLRGEDAFRFAHILLRDAAYSGIPKSARADLHERFADWMEARDVSGSYGEVLGHHLEQAHRLRSELGPADLRAQELAGRAAAALRAAGGKAFALGDMPAAASLLTRAVSLTSDDRARLELLPDLALALIETGDFGGFQDVMTETGTLARAAGDARMEAHATVLELWARLFTVPEGWAEEARREGDRAVAAFQELGDHRGLSRAQSLLGLVYALKCQFAAAEDAMQRALDHAAEAGDEREAMAALSWIPLMAWAGPKPVEECIRRCEQVRDAAVDDRKGASTARFMQGLLEAMRGRFDDARRLIADAAAALEEVALPVWTAGPLPQMSAWAELLAGDPVAAERTLRRGVEVLARLGEASWLSTTAAILAEAVYAQGRWDEVDELTRLAEEHGSTEDAYSQSLLRSVRAKAFARMGRSDEAVALGGEAVAMVRTTDFLFLHAQVLLDHAEVLRLAGRPDEAGDVLADALAVSERKGFVVAAERARNLLGAARR